MTGLDPERHVIVEMATLVTDDVLHIVAEGPDLVIGASAEQLDAMEDVVRNMHTTSGLLEQISRSTVTVQQAVADTLAFLRSQLIEPGVVPLCGNSIAMDRRFLQVYAPELEAFFHYRTIDVSTVKELCRRWRPELYAARPHKQTAHRAMDDIRESVAELEYYKGRFLCDVAGTEPAATSTPADAGSDPPV